MRALLALLIIGGIGFLLYKLVRYTQAQAQKQRAALAALAQKNRWHFDPDPSKSLHFRLRGVSNGVTWQLVGDSDAGSSDPSPSTTWSTNDITYHDLVGLVRTRKGLEVMESGWARAITGVLSVMISATGLAKPQHVEVVRSGTRLKAHSIRVDQDFVAIVRPDRGLDHLLTPALETALQGWQDSELLQMVKDSLSVDIGQSNLRVYCRGILAPEHMERFIGLGVATAAAIKGKELPAGPLV